MRSIFDEEERVERPQQAREAELTLGSGTLLAIFVGLVLLCGLCFGMGYAVGNRGSAPSAITPPQPAPDQEPLQASGNIPKPSAIAQTPIVPPDAMGADQAAGTAPGATGQTPATTAPGATTQTANAQPEGGSGYASAVHPALPSSAALGAASGAAQAVHPAFQPQPLMVQIAAVSNPEDAEVLVNALRQRNYPVTARRDPGDNYIHVRIGPFATRAIADQWRTKLLNDGYNAVIQP